MRLIDSSAIVKFFSKEPGWEKVQVYVSQSFSIPIAILELSNALRSKVISGGISLEKALNFITQYADSAVLLDQKKYLGSAFRISINNKITTYDSIFIAAALEENLDLISCDEEQSNVAEKLGIKVIRC